MTELENAPAKADIGSDSFTDIQNRISVLHVVPRILNEASGPSYSVPSLCRAIPADRARVRLCILEPLPERRLFPDVDAFPSSPFCYRLGRSPEMKRHLQRMAHEFQILHNHSLWMMPNVYCGTIRRPAGCKLIVSPRGTLSPWSWSRSRWRKGLLWRLGQRRALFAADCLHATSEDEYGQIRRLGLTAPVAVIPNGIDLTSRPEGADMGAGGEDNALAEREGGRRRLLFLSRIHPTKQVELLLRAWRGIETEFPDWELIVAGPLNVPYAEKMQAAARRLGLRRARFHREVRGREKELLFRSAELFVLPTQAENFGMAIAEALSHGVPAIVTRGAPWEGLERNRCGWWIENTESALAAALREAMSLPAEALRERGQRGRAWMERDFAWDQIGERMLETYAWMLRGGPAPAWVHLN